MQIVSGKYRHRKLHTNPGQTTRPITARVKVALFDRLQQEWQDKRVADIFAGTGTLGFEALSRGARSVVFIENDRVAYELLQRNVSTLKAEAETVCWRTDASKSSFRPHRADGFFPYDIVFFDPPYLHTTRLKEHTMLFRSLARLARPQVTAPGALLILRCARGTEFEIPGPWTLEQRLEYSSMDVHLFRKPASEPDLSAEPMLDESGLEEPGAEPHSLSDPESPSRPDPRESS